MAQNVVELGFNIEELKAEKQEVLGIFVDLFGKLEEYDGTKFNPLGGGGLGDLRKSINDGAKAMGEFLTIAAKYNETITEQAKRTRDLAKANEELAASRKGTGQGGGSGSKPSSGGGGPTSAPDEDTFARKAEQDNIDRAARLKAKVGQATSDTAKDAAVDAERLRTLNAEIKASAQAYLAEIGSIDEATAAIKRLKTERNAVNAETEVGKQKIADLNVLIDQNNEFIRANSSGLEKVKINIGNYPGAFKEAFEVLREQLASTKAGLSDLEAKGASVVNDLSKGNPIGFDPGRHKGDVTNLATAGGGTVNVAAGDAATYQELSTKAAVLEKNLERLSVGFKTTRQEERAFKEAAVEVGLAIGQESEEFLIFNKAIGGGLNGINDIKAATKFQASDAKFITGLADAASTLAGGFGAAQAAAALFGGEDEDLQKQMAKFQQLLVLINGLQSLANGLQAESGGIQLLLSARTHLLNAAKGVQLLLTTRAIQVIAAETSATAADAAATETLAIAKTEAAVAEEAQTAASVQNTEATTANAAANTAAAGATKGLSTALIAGGIATLAIGAGVALALLTAKLIGFGEQEGLTIKQQEQLADAMKNANAVIIEQSEFIKALDSATKNYYQNQLALSQAAGLNQYKQFALQKQIADAEKESAQQQIDALGATNKQQAELASTIQLLNDKRLAAIRIEQALLAIPDKDRTGAQNDQLKAAQANVEFYQKQIDSVRGLYDAGQKAREDLFASIQKQGQLELQEQKFTADEQRKLTLETTKLEIDAQKDRNSKILADARSTLTQRLAAIRSNRDQEKKEADADLKSARSQFKEGLITPAEVESAERQANAARARADRDYLASKHQEERAAYERDRDAALAAYRVQLEQQIKLAQDLQQGKQNNPNPLEAIKEVPLSDRLSGLSQEYEARRQLLNAELKVELDKEGQTAEEKKAIYEKYGADISDLGRDFKEKYLGLEKEAQERSIAEWKKYYQLRQNDISSNEIEQLRDLEDARNKDLINLRAYHRQRQKIEDEAAVARAQAAVQDAYVAVNATKAGTKERADAEGKLTDTVRSLSDTVKKKTDDTTNAQRDKILNTLSDIETGYKNMTVGVGAILDISTDNQKAKIQDLEADQEKSYESQVARIQGTTVSEEERAARVTFLEKQRATQKEANDRRTRQLDNERAQFEKQAAVATIILDTTAAIVGFLKDPGGFAGIALSVTAGIAGAAQLAKAVATQVPHYKLGAGVNGRPLHSGGLFVAGDGGEQELITEPGKKPFLSPNTPTLLNAGPMTSVVPISMLDEMSRSWITDQGILAFQSDNSEMSSKLDRLNNTMVWMAGTLKESAKANRPRVTVINNIGKDLAHAAWVKKNVFD